MQGCCKDCTAITERWMSVENVKNLGTAEKFDIYILPLYLTIIRLNNVDYTIVL